MPLSQSWSMGVLGGAGGYVGQTEAGPGPESMGGA